MRRIAILGVPVDSVTCEEVANRILCCVAAIDQEQIICVNAEGMVAAQNNHAYREVLHRSSLNVPDGAGVCWAARRRGVELPERVSGLDVLLALARRPAGQVTGVRLFLLGAAEGVAEIAAGRLREINPSLAIAGTYAGFPCASEDQPTVDRINAARPSVILVAYGSPAQEIWIDRNLRKLPTVRVAMGVGGAFDFLAGVQRRAPALLQKFGLEWLWRLCGEPRKRWRRIVNAVVVFPWMVLCNSGKQAVVSGQH